MEDRAATDKAVEQALATKVVTTAAMVEATVFEAAAATSAINQQGHAGSEGADVHELENADDEQKPNLWPSHCDGRQKERQGHPI